MKPYTTNKFLSGQFLEFCNQSSLVFYNQICFVSFCCCLCLFVGQLELTAWTMQKKECFCFMQVAHLPYGSCKILRFNHEKWQVIEILGSNLSRHRYATVLCPYFCLFFCLFSIRLPHYFFLFMYYINKFHFVCNRERKKSSDHWNSGNQNHSKLIKHFISYPSIQLCALNMTCSQRICLFVFFSFFCTWHNLLLSE